MGATVQEIGYAFLQTYYHRMSKDPSKVSCLYSATAELTHTNYQMDFLEDSDILPTVKLTGKENISKFFTRNNKKVSDLKVRVETCDFQTTGLSHASILILTTGEMFWTGTPTYKFCQTIILTPSGSKDTFDVTNDVIRFISDNIVPEKFQDLSKEKLDIEDHAELQQEPQQESSKPEPETEQNNSESKESAQPKLQDPRGSIDVKEEQSKKESHESFKPELKEYNKEETKAEIKEESKQNSKEPSQDGAPTQQPVRISWASKLAANGDSSKANSEPQYNGTRRAVDTKSEIPNRRDINNRTAKKKTIFSTVNKDGYYPIYIKGTAGVKENRLKSALEAEFGTVMKITNADSFAVVDFETQKSQMDALERRQLTIDDIEIIMGRKTVKKSPSPPVGGTQTPFRSHKKHSGKKRD
ncbi:BN860_00672g1_1 [Zygosaccharomyces bailii CLIB 213]|uniref:BN860_00672g1_1 n=1 Tax=Zygosaccharomyces bailii (strain CLIB 213 / ATCC 58445 / CBS 680 / BCRC 21525 / NBRC 1098 / NCYC 1416 / NRRL Y-2227) TaxID=1333698 RepID=A0A8J2T4R3_ZYGB2|nr:BN860_00672g1_1 [Zygosaccharomyces bailii CLIB 213]